MRQWGFFIILVLGFLLLPLPVGAVDEIGPKVDECARLLEVGREAKILSRLEKVNPQLHSIYNDKRFDLETLEELYLALKAEAWLYLPKGQLPWKERPSLPDLVSDSLKENFKKQYAVESLTDSEIYLFYTNALWSLYNFVFQTWVGEQIERISPPTGLSQLQKSFAQAVISQHLVPLDLQSQTLAPELATEFFESKPNYTQFPWSSAFQIVAVWERSRFERPAKTGYRDLRSWLEQKAEFTGLTLEHQRIVTAALHRGGFEEVCCLTKPGCSFCPNNRNTLR